MQLVSLPDVCKVHPDWFTLNHTYPMLGVFGVNGVITVNDLGTRCIVLRERFA